MIPNIKILREIVFHWGNILSLFRILKKRKKITGYSLTSLTLVSNVLSLKIQISDKYWIIFKFFRSNRILNKCSIAEVKRREISILVGDCEMRDLYKLILLEIWDIVGTENGFIAEEVFLSKTADQIKVTEGTKGHNSDDDHGIDFWIEWAEQRVPLQLKTSSFFQRKHKQKYPNIPSLVYKDEYTPEHLKKLLIKICSSYKKGIIEHL